MTMAKMWKISEASSIGLHAMVLLASTRKPLVRTREIAEVLKVSEAHLSKVLQRLAKAGLVSAIRGPSGGFSLKKNPERITLLSVYEAIEGPLVPTTCLLDSPVCRGDKCILGGLVVEINKRLREYMAETTLSELVKVYAGIDADCLRDNPRDENGARRGSNVRGKRARNERKP
jgi:Rrf2 family protein